MAVTYAVAQSMIDLIASTFGGCFTVLDQVVLISSGVPVTGSLTVLDGFLIGLFIFDFVWEVIDHARGV